MAGLYFMVPMFEYLLRKSVLIYEAIIVDRFFG